MKKRILPIIVLLILFMPGIAQTWIPLGSGFNGAVNTLTTYNGDLYAGGAFTTAGGITVNRVAKWDGSNWSALGAGMDNTVFELVVFNGELYAAGVFRNAGGIAADRIAKWNGSTWSAVGTGLSASAFSSTIYNGSLYVCGDFTLAGGVTVNRVARWDGTNWSALGAGINNGSVRGITVYNGEIYAGGLFQMAGGVAVSNIAKWDGTSWSAVGMGTNGFIFDAMSVYNDELYIGGPFTTAGGLPANWIAKWNGSTWSSLGSGLTGGIGSIVRGLGVFNGELIVGGIFATAGGTPVQNIAKWNGTSWSLLIGMNKSVIKLYEHNQELYAAGDFTIAGSNPANRIARWSPPCLITTSGGADENLIFGYGSVQCKTKTAGVSNGTSPYTYSWTLDRSLLPGESITGTTTASVTACLVDTAQLLLSVTDARNCTATDSVMFFVKDVRCFASNNQKVMICHKGNTLCIDENSVAAHLVHGDYVGLCIETVAKAFNPEAENISSPGFNIYPNPGKGNFTITLTLPEDKRDQKLIRIINAGGQVVKEFSMQGKNKLSIIVDKTGIYFVQMVTGKQVISKKLIVIR